jgi:hypothetical protein
MIEFASFLPQMICIEQPSFMAMDFSNENQCSGAAVPPVAIREKRVPGAFMPQTGGARR